MPTNSLATWLPDMQASQSVRKRTRKPTTKFKNQPECNFKSVVNWNIQARKLADCLATQLASWLES